MLEVRLEFLCTSRSGTLSRIIREIGQVGLRYQNHQIANNDGYTHLVINAAGELNCSRESFAGLFDKFPEILQLQEFSVTEDGREVTEFKTTISDTHVSTAEHLTPAVVLAAEKRLSEIMGPVASLIVEAVKDSCADAGELYARLAEELNDDEERAQFLAIVDEK